MWNSLMLELAPDDLLIHPMLGAGGMTREQALAEVQSLLDRSAPLMPAFAAAAETWRRGAKDDTVFAELFTWAVYEYDGHDPASAAMEWIEDYAETMRAAGLDVSVPRLPGV
jgi:hypothetical protein